jgi:hypothetical protein
VTETSEWLCGKRSLPDAGNAAMRRGSSFSSAKWSHFTATPTWRRPKHYGTATALAAELGVRSLDSHCHVGLGKLYRRTADAARSQELFTIAATIYCEMGMTLWVEKAEAERGVTPIGTHPKPGRSSSSCRRSGPGLGAERWPRMARALPAIVRPPLAGPLRGRRTEEAGPRCVLRQSGVHRS